MGWEGEEVYRAGVGVLTGWVVAWPSHVCPLALLPGLVLDPPKEAASPSLEEPFSHVQTLCPIFLLPFTSNSALLTLSPLLCLGLLLRLQPSPWYLTVPFPSSSQDSPGESVMPPMLGCCQAGGQGAGIAAIPQRVGQLWEAGATGAPGYLPLHTTLEHSLAPWASPSACPPVVGGFTHL